MKIKANRKTSNDLKMMLSKMPNAPYSDR